jgi:hypothetical protein
MSDRCVVSHFEMKTKNIVKYMKDDMGVDQFANSNNSQKFSLM